MSKLDDLFWWTMDVASENGILPVAIPKDKFKDRVKKIMFELINENEPPTADDAYDTIFNRRMGRNTLCDNLREKVDEL